MQKRRRIGRKKVIFFFLDCEKPDLYDHVL